MAQQRKDLGARLLESRHTARQIAAQLEEMEEKVASNEQLLNEVKKRYSADAPLIAPS